MPASTKNDKPKPFESIAARHKISNESAKYFLGQVQKSFKNKKPPQQLVVDFMAKEKFKALPEAHAVATMMYESGLWEHALNAAPPTVVDEEDVYF
jgi:hypothetical protein